MTAKGLHIAQYPYADRHWVVGEILGGIPDWVYFEPSLEEAAFLNFEIWRNINESMRWSRFIWSPFHDGFIVNDWTLRPRPAPSEEDFRSFWPSWCWVMQIYLEHGKLRATIDSKEDNG